jgi:hypothetical protein
MKISLEQAYQAGLSAGQATAKAQGDVDDWNARQPTLVKALSDAKAAQATAEGTLLAVAGLLPPDQEGRTADGHSIKVVDGQVKVFAAADASTVVYDDGQPDPTTDTGGGTVPPTPDPTTDPNAPPAQ